MTVTNVMASRLPQKRHIFTDIFHAAPTPPATVPGGAAPARVVCIVPEFLPATTALGDKQTDVVCDIRKYLAKTFALLFANLTIGGTITEES